MAKFNEYPAKTTPKDADKFMLYSAEDAANKLIDYDKLADAVLNKLTSKTFGLDAGTMTLPAALNQLNSKAQIPEFSGNIDSLNGRCIVVANAKSTGTLPKGLSGNRYLIMCDSVVGPNGITYGIQLAVSFGSSNIAVRNSNFNGNGSKAYRDWRYI